MAVRSLLSVFLIGAGALGSLVEAGQGPFSPEPGSRLLSPAAPLRKADLLAQRAGLPPEERQREPDAQLPTDERRRNPIVAGLLSAAVPGAGQFYNGNQLGYLFLGVETAAWLAHFSMHDTGMDIQDQFKKFADQHWAWERYRDTSFEDCPPEGHSDLGGSGVQDSTLMSLYNTRRDDFYEDIGKLSIYFCGWDAQSNKDIYRDMREDSNNFLRNARYATTVVFLNHLVSAIQAARGAARHNARLTGSMEIDLNLSPQLANPMAQLVLSHHF
jgi:hypothetical protein